MLSAASLFLVMMAMSGVMLLVLSSLVHSGARGIREWLTANALAVLAMPLFAARGHVPDLLSIELANTLLIATNIAMVVGVRRHLAQPVPWPALAACGILGAAAVVALHHGIDSMKLRIVAVSVLHGGLCIVMCASVAQALPAAPRRYPYRFMIAASGMVAVGMLLRGAVYAAQVAGWTPPIDEPTLSLVFFSTGVLSMPALTLGAVMMANAEIIARANHAADHDYLTGAPSRRAFFAAAERERARAARGHAPLSLLLFDIDHFKRINDTHGHAVGDQVLVEIVGHACGALRGQDLCGRLGGEEFGALLPGTPADTALQAGERLRAALQRTPADALPGGSGVGYTVSIGVATLEPGETVASLMSRADLALYAAKSGGRNCVRVAQARRTRPERMGA
jgi:diguanylate cyclase (GGDEF)-like protein